MKVEEQLRLEFCSPLFCEPASTSHRHLVYKTPRRGLTSQKGPGGRRTGWVTWCSASSRGPGEMSLCHYVTVSLCHCVSASPADTPVLMGPGQAHWHTGSTLPTSPSCLCESPGFPQHILARWVCWHPACACTQQALWTQMPWETTPAGRQLRLGLEKHPKTQRKNRIMKCMSWGRKEENPPSYTQQ